MTKNALSPSSAKKRAREPSRPPEASDARGDGDHKIDDGDEDATKGEWLFKQDELVLGPVTSIVLVDKLKKGELGGDTPIARDGAAFRPMKLVRLFREAWQAAEEEKRFAAEERAHQSSVSRSRLLRVVVMLLLIAGPAAGAAAGARAVMIARPWDDSPAWIARVPPMVDLPQKPPDVKSTPTTTPAGPAVAAAAAAADEEDEEDDKSGRPRDPNRPKRPKKDPSAAAVTTTASAGETATNATPAQTEPKNTAGLPGELTNAQAVAPLKEIQGDLKGCFKAEMDSNADMPGAVVLSYTVTEDGKAINVDLDARELRGRPVVGCVQKAMGTVRWPKFNGERKNVSVPFKLGKPKPTPAKP